MGANEIAKVKFASQADATVLENLKTIAKTEGRQLQSVIEEAFTDLIEKRRGSQVRPEVKSALQASKRKFDALYRELAK
jgi:hypothetical protein